MPSNIEIQGYGVPIYVNIKYPWGNPDPPRIPHDNNPVGSYHRDFVTLNLDLMQMGVGGDDSWGAKPHDPYRLQPKPYGYRFCLMPFSAAETDPKQLARRCRAEGLSKPE